MMKINKSDIEITKRGLIGKPDILKISVNGKTYQASERTQWLSFKVLEKKLALLT